MKSGPDQYQAPIPTHQPRVHLPPQTQLVQRGGGVMMMMSWTTDNGMR